jgi:calcium-binding protein CML
MEGGTSGSMIFSLLDQSSSSQSIHNHSLGSSVPSLESEKVFRSSRADSASETSEECSTSKSVEDDHHSHHQKNCSATFSERKRCYSVDEAELHRVFNRFDQNEDGLISGEELGRYMKCCYGNEMSDAEVTSMVSSVDRNNDGAVDFEEFLSLYQKSARCSADDAVEEVADQDEEDKDDLLKTFSVFDRNHDGYISAQELQIVLLNLGMPQGKSLINCVQMIRHVDRDGDGQCDLVEFQEMMSAQSSSQRFGNQ